MKGELNPGIAKTVAWLNAHNFTTVDSGDGKTHDYACDREYPYVVLRCHCGELVDEARRLQSLLSARGTTVEPICPDGSVVCIQATYDPADGDDVAFIDLMGLDDARLFKEGT